MSLARMPSRSRMIGEELERRPEVGRFAPALERGRSEPEPRVDAGVVEQRPSTACPCGHARGATGRRHRSRTSGSSAPRRARDRLPAASGNRRATGMSSTAICSVSRMRSAPATECRAPSAPPPSSAVNGWRLRTRIRMSPGTIRRPVEASVSPLVRRADLCRRCGWRAVPPAARPAPPRAATTRRQARCRPCCSVGQISTRPAWPKRLAIWRMVFAEASTPGVRVSVCEHLVDRAQHWLDGAEGEIEGIGRHGMDAALAMSAKRAPILANMSGAAPWNE